MDAIIHLAAISNDPTGDIDDTLTRQVNFDAIGLLLAQARAAGVKRFINASSSSVFGVRDVADINESLKPSPIRLTRNIKCFRMACDRGGCAGFLHGQHPPATICGYSPRQRFDLYGQQAHR
jgi:nucleoside-diphosphate-sugar epimerase